MLSIIREYLYKVRDEEPGRERENKSEEGSLHPCFCLIDSGTISCDTTRELHLHCMIDECYDRDSTRDSEEHIDRSYDDEW